MNDITNLIADPSAIITDSPEKVLDEISAVLRKHGYVLQEAGKPFVLARIIDTVRMQALAVARVRTITPTHYEWQSTKNPLAAFARKVQ